MTVTFSMLGVQAQMEDILKKNGITEPTPIQEQAIPAMLAGKDVIAQAQTGTGKTLAFLLPMMKAVDVSKPFVQALIITPTRELAIQITAEARKVASIKNVNLLAAYGGQDVEQQIKKLKGSIHVVIGTPGRLLDHLRRKTVDFSRLNLLVLDEADQMLDMGFLKEIEQIIAQTSAERQTALFSATMPAEIRKLAARYMRDPVQIRIQSPKITLDEIKQIIVETTDRAKQDALCDALKEYNPFLAIIFCRTKRRTSTLNEALQRRGFQSDELHGDLSQAKREKVMRAFREAKLQVLVATDVAARGLDIEGVTHVFNYDIPQDTESYIHRIGRTGRAGQAGVAITFVAPKDREFLHIIEKGIKADIEKTRFVKEQIPEEGFPAAEKKAGNYGRTKSGPANRQGSPKGRRDDRARGRNSDPRGERRGSGKPAERSRTQRSKPRTGGHAGKRP